MFKKVLIFLLIVSLVFCTTACVNDDKALETDAVTSAVSSNGLSDDKSQTTNGITQDEVITSSSSKVTSENSKPIFESQTKPTHTHNYSAATCLSPAKCSCGATTGNALEHKYVNFKCSLCGNVRPNSEIDRLKEYILENGEAKGSFTNIYWYDKYNTNSISYDANENVVYFSYAETLDNGEIVYTEIVLNKSFNHKFYCDYAKQSEMRGYINAKTFNKNSPLGCDDYSGDPAKREMFIDDTRMIIVYLLEEVKARLIEMNVGVSISDIGFISF